MSSRIKLTHVVLGVMVASNCLGGDREWLEAGGDERCSARERHDAGRGWIQSNRSERSLMRRSVICLSATNLVAAEAFHKRMFRMVNANKIRE